MRILTPDQITTMPGSPLGVLRAFQRDPLAMCARARDLGGIVSIPSLSDPVFAVSQPEAVLKLLSASPDLVWKGTSEELFGNRPWAVRRKAVQPHFRREAAETWPEIIRKHADALVEAWIASPGPVEVVADMNRMTQRVICEAMLGVVLDPDTEARAMRSLDVILSGFTWKTMLPGPGASPSIRHRRAVASLHAVADAIIGRLRSGPAPGVIGASIAANDRGDLSSSDLRGEVITLLLAAHETTANTVAWTLGLLTHAPEVLASVSADARLGQMGLVDAAVSEGVRLFPPAWVLARDIREPIDLGSATLPAGSRVFVPIAAIHRDPRTWRDPDAFRPDRWTAPAQKGTYLPFGAGPRGCIGEHLARLESREVVTRVLQQARIEAVEGLPEPEPGVTLRPRGDMKLRVLER